MATSLRLAQTAFETKPDENLAAVDVYKAVETGEVVNSYQDKADTNNGFGFDLSNLLGSVDIKSALQAAKQATSFAKKAAGIYSSLKNGNFAAALGGVAGVAGGLGIGQVIPALRTAQKAIGSASSFASNPSISGALSMGGIALASTAEGASLSRLGSLASQAQRQLTGFSNAVNSNNILGMVSSADRLTSGALSSYSVFDKMAQQDFGYAASKAIGMSGSVVSGKESLDALLGTATALSKNETKFVDYSSDTAIQAGTIAGISWATAQQGIKNAFSSSVNTSTVQGRAIAKAAGIPLAQEAIKSGDFELYKDIITATPEVRQDITSAIPNSLRTMLGTIKVPKTVASAGLSNYYDQVIATDPSGSWKTAKRGNDTVLNSLMFSQNADAELLLQAKTDTIAHNFESAQVPDEAFLRLGALFKGESTMTSIQEDFPEYYSTVTDEAYEGFFV